MAAARTESDWGRTASLMALLANCHRDPKKRGPYYARDFMPGRRGSSGLPITADNIRALKIFVKD